MANDIKNSGPVWVHWTFVMERFCQFVKSNIRSRRHPWSQLSWHILYTAYLSQLRTKFDLEDELETMSYRRAPGLQRNEVMIDGCMCLIFIVREVILNVLDPDQVLRAPRRLTHIPDADTRRRIGIYFTAIFQNRRGWSQVVALLPMNMQIWGKM